MSIIVSSIIFDHGRGNPGSYTVALRFNENEQVWLPEWQHGSRFPSVAAYLRDRLPPVAVVLARFAITSDEPRWLQIRAHAQTQWGFSSPHPILPDLPPLWIRFSAAGDSGWCAYPLDTALMSFGVNAVTQQWVWQYRRSIDDAWVNFDTTWHRTYILLSAPTEPWLVWPPGPTNTCLPRTDALDFACGWVHGARNEIEVATRITEAVNQLGGKYLTYDSAVGAPHYTVLGVPQFLCDMFIERLLGGEGAGPLVNCSDCATIVSTFANLVGADLWQSKMGLIGGGFRLNPILAIGQDEWSTVQGGFSFHEVAWSGNCGEQDTVYDACIHTDRDPNPSRAPHLPSLPANQIFGTAGSGHYRDQIAAPSDRNKCIPQPALRDRRAISARVVSFVPDSVIAIRRELSELVELQKPAEVGGEEIFFEGFHFFGREFPGWSMVKVASFVSHKRPAAVLADLPAGDQIRDADRVLVSQWVSADRPMIRLRVESIETASATHARQTLLRTASEIEFPELENWDRGVSGETALQSPNGALVIFTRGNLVHIVRSAGHEMVDVRKEVDALDRWLTDAGSPAGVTGSGGPTVSPGPTWRRIHIASAKPDPALADGKTASRSIWSAPVGGYIVSAMHAQAWTPD